MTVSGSDFRIDVDLGELSGDNQSFQRAVAVLNGIAAQVADGRAEASLTALAKQTGMAKSTVHRLLRGLCEAGFAVPTPEGKYQLGRDLIRLGELSRTTNLAFASAVSSLRRLAAFTGDAVFYTERRGTVSLCVWREDGNGPFRNNILSVGDVHPLGVSAGALAILADLPEDEANQVMAENLMTFSPDTLAGSALRNEMFAHEYVEARQSGWALNTGWWVEDSWAVGMAIPGSVRDGGGAALSVATIRTRLQEPRRSQILAALRCEVELLASRTASEPESGKRRAGRDD